MVHYIKLVLVLLFTIDILSGNAVGQYYTDGDPTIKAYVGGIASIGNGTAAAWVATKNHKPIAMGVTFTESALEGLPAQDTEYVIPLPSQAALTGFKQIAVNWNPHGHIPPGIYDVPHLDFHFYLIDEKERNVITAKGDDLAKVYKKPDAAYLPSGYVLGEGSEMPRMGIHWIDSASLEFHGQPFTKTFIYGSYNGRISFVEPMVALQYLKIRPNSVESIKTPAAYAVKGYYPTEYKVAYDETRKQYAVALQGLTLREAHAQR